MTPDDSNKADDSTKSPDDSKFKGQIEVWTGYTEDLASVGGLLVGTEAVCARLLSAAVASKVAAVLHAAYEALQGVDQELIDGIDQMKKGEAPRYSFEPSVMPDWPSDPSSAGVFLGAWETIKAGLEKMMSTTPSSSALAAAISGLINKGDKCVEVLEEAFG